MQEECQHLFEIYFDLGFTRAAKPQPETFSPRMTRINANVEPKGAAVYNYRDLEAFGQDSPL
jgi:hypothetical protein